MQPAECQCLLKSFICFVVVGGHSLLMNGSRLCDLTPATKRKAPYS